MDVDRLAHIQSGGEPLTFTNGRPDGMNTALAALKELIDELKTPWKNIIVGGFSQGAMMAIELALCAPETPRGLFILSGNLVDAENIRKLAPHRKGLKFFQSHGRQDPILKIR